MTDFARVLFDETAPAPAPRRPEAGTGIAEDVPADVRALFEKLALDVAATGMKRFSADAILHRIRWYHVVERSDPSFKINDHYSSALARWFLARHPKLGGFFELRSLRKKEGECVE